MCTGGAFLAETLSLRGAGATSTPLLVARTSYSELKAVLQKYIAEFEITKEATDELNKL